MPTVNGEPYEAGCYVDGHWGQYGASRVLGIADAALSTHYWEEAGREARIASQQEARLHAEVSRRCRRVGSLSQAVDVQRQSAYLYEQARDPFGTMTDELSGCEVVSWIADEAEIALNDATVGGFWEWSDGEFFLVETAGECPECGGTLGRRYSDEVYCLDEMCGYGAEVDA